MYIDGKQAMEAGTATQGPAKPAHALKPNMGLMRLLACFVAAVMYIWQEQLVFSFSQVQLIAVILGVSLVSLGLYLFVRGPSRIQPPEPIAGTLYFVGWHTLEIYAIQLAGSELIIKLVPSLAP